MKSLSAVAENILKSPDYRQDIDEEIYSNDDEYQVLKTKLPKGVDIREAMEYGFFEYRHRYWMRRKSEFEPISNFTIRVLFLIRGANPKRIVELTNYKGRKAVMDFAIEDLISVERFKGKVESQGNFLFEGRATDLGRIKNKLFSMERPSMEIAQLGQQRDKFFAFANGVHRAGEFLPVDENGMVVVGDEHYYIPVFGATQDEDNEDLRNYRKFIHRDGAVTFSDWSKQFLDVYGENGKVCIAFALFALFSDIVFEKTKAAPMLFLFGQRGSGKGTMANSLMALYGFPQDPIMLGGASTVVGFMRKLGQFKNAIVWMDEYKNDIDVKKIESLKNIWDRVGYERGVKDATNRTQTTPVTSSAIISGQEIPVVEPALFSRCILLELATMKRGQDEINKFDALRRMEDTGITSCTLEALRCRDAVKEKFMANFSEISAAFRRAFANTDIIDRQVTNYAILVAVIQCVQEQLKLPFDYANLMLLCEKLAMRQKGMMKQSNEVQQFWEMVDFMLSAKLLKHGEAIQVTDDFVKVRMGVVYPLYREAAQRQRSKVIDRGTLQNYLESSPAYCEKETKKPSHRFSGLQSPTTCQVYLHKTIKDLHGLDFMETIQEPENQQVNPF